MGKKEYQHRYGWYWLAKEVADYCNTTFFEIMNRSALEVVGLTLIIQNQIEYKNMK